MKKALGRGLSSLIPDSYVGHLETQTTQGAEARVEGLELIPIDEITPNRYQPRQLFDAEGIEELAASIREKGILQPIVVKKIKQESALPREGRRYELICGERRLKAALLSGLEKVPAIVKDVAESDFLEWALVENIQREDLNPLEEARAFERLATERNLSQDDVAKRVGKSRTAVTNAIRLLRLPEEVLGYVREGRLTAGHARALVSLFSSEHQIQLARRIVKENLSVRQVEDLVARSARKRRARQSRRLTPEVADLENRLARFFGTEVRVFARKNSPQGRIVIHYFSLDDLDRILKQVDLPPTV